jgi:hypothetical protein
MVPPFEDMFGRGDWRPRTQEWLQRFFGLRFTQVEGHDFSVLPEFYIANGLSARGVHHSVIYRRGELAHDPHWQRGGIEKVEWCWYLEYLVTCQS